MARRSRFPSAAAMMRIGLLLIAALLASGPECALASFRHAYMIPDQRRVVQGWQVENVAEDDGGRIVRMTRRVGPYVLAYGISFWRANPGPLAQADMDLPDQRSCGHAEWRRDPGSANLWRPETGLAARAGAVRELFRQGLAACHVAAGQAAAALRGFDQAFALTARWAEASRRATIAESE